MLIKNNKNFKQSNILGFTLIEIVIAVAIFSLLSTVVGGIYVAFSQSQKRTQAGQKLLGETQFVLESIAREIRNGEVDYTVDCNDFGGSACLIIRRLDDTQIAFILDNDESLKYQVYDGTSWQSTGNFLPVSDSTLENFHFIITPETDPFAEGGPNRMPMVTIQAQVRASGQNVEQVTYNLQTSASSRIFPE